MSENNLRTRALGQAGAATARGRGGRDRYRWEMTGGRGPRCHRAPFCMWPPPPLLVVGAEGRSWWQPGVGKLRGEGLDLDLRNFLGLGVLLEVVATLFETAFKKSHSGQPCGSYFTGPCTRFLRITFAGDIF